VCKELASEVSHGRLKCLLNLAATFLCAHVGVVLLICWKLLLSLGKYLPSCAVSCQSALNEREVGLTEANEENIKGFLSMAFLSFF